MKPDVGTLYIGFEIVLKDLFAFHHFLIEGNTSYERTAIIPSCLFSEDLCYKYEPLHEECYNDRAFGRCVPVDGTLSNEELYQYNLEPRELEVLRSQLERLEFEGYKWTHEYTQCIMQILLDDLRYRVDSDAEEICEYLRIHGADKYEGYSINRDAIGSTREEQQRQPVAMLKFAPSKLELPQGDAKSRYYPRLTQTDDRLDQNPIDHYNEDYDEDDIDDLYDKLGSIGSSGQVYRRGSRSLSPESLQKAAASYQDNLERATDRDQWIASDDDLTMDQILDNLGSINRHDSHSRIQDPSVSWKLPRFDSLPPTDYDNVPWPSPYKADDPLERAFAPLDDDEDNDSAINSGDDYDYGSEESVDLSYLLNSPERIGSTEAIVEPEPVGADELGGYDDETLDSDLADLLGRGLAGFKRRERLDVKKPGPPFLTNNFAFRTQSSDQPDDESSDGDLQDNEISYIPQQVKKESPDSKSINTTSITTEHVNFDHVYVKFNHEFHTWFEGEKVVNMIGSMIGLQPGELKEIDVGVTEITFRVPKNSKDYNATDIVHKIDNVRNDLQKQLNMKLIEAGIGNKAKQQPAMLQLDGSSENSDYMSPRMFNSLVAAGGAAAVAAAGVVLFLARQHAKSRAKLAGLRTPDPEASKDYQDLCRARMHAKQADKLRSESPRGFDFGRLIETGRSESNRSSTSSWGEEPPVSGMDITTGHLVLSYMEEHLKNTQKLEEEWAALCAYEPEPCSTAIAEAEGNSECNRQGAALPFDHSRVVLNDLANINNSDYINASTITDHDPRNPAYIATQGPLDQTSSDFWQLVWEQGSVVIVMLTRLTENSKSMCHRYWPDEGSEQYHNYEVHLVSEHVWCDDYLVRSFYLKNLRTGETRTVTQFHFLGWPHDAVPNSTKALLEFRRKVNKAYRGRSCPIIVHCSDGAGRTGTYCLIDMVLNRMSKGAKEIDIAATLEHIRDQRAGMVSSKQQYEFALMAVAEEVHAILKSLPAAVQAANEHKQNGSSPKSANSSPPPASTTSSKSDK
ncbi:hypothetical protein QAD02_015827 [Eretmocerus hayati]|uniref:Uncharacterized protein n=1 Tax=Eretmocerus hayati TaxID=131215 RepID=A0ACC2PE40_9HYME|nr:hypothetical protein QAD02_015827 [Eretmocerus hayati]